MKRAVKTRLGICLMLASFVTLLAACGLPGTVTTTPVPAPTPVTSAIPSITITATDTATGYAYEQPQNIQEGLVDLTFVNKSKMPHQIQLVRINDGNYDEFAAALKKNGPVGSTLQMVTGAGGANEIDPGGQQEVILNLTTGEYATLCFVQDADNTFHYMKGMLQHLTVTQRPQVEPKADAVVTLQDFAINLPKTNFPAGQTTWKVTNNGPQLHEMAILKLNNGITFDQFEKMISSNAPPSGPPPFTAVGGMGALQPGTSGWMKLNLIAGNYVAICFVPDAKTGKPHFMLGMKTHFTVS